jgi:hypothetical protein
VGGLFKMAEKLDGCGKKISGSRKKLIQPVI